jgi:hypothetical protein
MLQYLWCKPRDQTQIGEEIKMSNSLKRLGLTQAAVMVMMSFTTLAIAQDNGQYDTAEDGGDYASQSLLSPVENTASRILNIATDSGIVE